MGPSPWSQCPGGLWDAEQRAALPLARSWAHLSGSVVARLPEAPICPAWDLRLAASWKSVFSFKFESPFAWKIMSPHLSMWEVSVLILCTYCCKGWASGLVAPVESGLPWGPASPFFLTIFPATAGICCLGSNFLVSNRILSRVPPEGNDMVIVIIVTTFIIILPIAVDSEK